MSRRWMRNSLIYLLIVVAVIMVFFLFFDSGPLDGAQGIPISEVVELAENPGNERTMIEVALQHTGGRKRDAAALLGWGRNTLTRKIKELEMESQLSGADDD